MSFDTKLNLLENASSEELEVIYNEGYALWEKNLKPRGVTKPGKFGSNGGYQFIFLYSNLKKLVHKSQVEKFVKRFNPDARDQQPRHFSTQAGYNGYKGNEVTPDGNVVPGGSRSGNIILWDLENVAESFSIAKRKNDLSSTDWGNIKEAYDFRCATCGNIEGERDWRNPSKIVTLDKGHMDITKPLVSGNIIPQCSYCNGQYRDKFIFNKNGNVYAVASTEAVEKAPVYVKEEIYQTFGF